MIVSKRFDFIQPVGLVLLEGHELHGTPFFAIEGSFAFEMIATTEL